MLSDIFYSIQHHQSLTMGLIFHSAAMIPAIIPLGTLKQPGGIFLLAAVLIYLLRYIFYLTSGERHIRNRNGRKMKELPEDTRVTRFSQGFDVSRAGQKLAGDDPFIVRNSGRREVVLTTPEHLKDFFKNDATAHFKPPGMNLGYFFSLVLGECLGIKGGKRWSDMRGQVEPHFSHSTARDFVPIFANEFQNWLSELPDNPTVISHTEKAFSIDAREACKHIPFKLIAMVTYGEMFNETNFKQLLSLNELHERVIFNAVFSKRHVSRLYCLFPTKEIKQLDDFHKRWEDLNVYMVEESQRTGKYCPAAIMHNGIEKGIMNKQEWLQTLDEILFTNIDVTSSVMAFLLVNIAQSRHIQDQLRTEITEHVREGEPDEAQKVYDYTHTNRTLLHNVILESLRISPAAWFSFPEITSTDRVIGGYHVPKGTAAIIDWKRVNTKSEIWGNDGDKFRPSRFEKLSPSQYRYSFLQFGIGTRKCLGKNITNILLKLFLIIVLRKYDLSGVDQEEIRLKKNVFTRTPEQLVKFTPRSRA